jgi:hypothetical protein
MTKKTRYQATTPDGRHIVTRTSACEYTCALAVHHPYVLGPVIPAGPNVPEAYTMPVQQEGRSIMSFHGTSEAAAECAKQWMSPEPCKQRGGDRFDIVPVQVR